MPGWIFDSDRPEPNRLEFDFVYEFSDWELYGSMFCSSKCKLPNSLVFSIFLVNYVRRASFVWNRKRLRLKVWIFCCLTGIVRFLSEFLKISACIEEFVGVYGLFV